MNNLINPSVYANTFIIPAGIADQHIKVASPNQLKVILYIFRHSNQELDCEIISSALSLDKEEVDDAISYWAGAGYLNAPTKAAATKKAVSKNARMQSDKPSREEVARLAATDSKLQFLQREAQSIFARPLKSSEASLFAWLYSDEGMDVSVILMLLHFAVQQGKVNTRFIEATAIDWIDSGVETIADAEEKTREALSRTQSWNLVCSAFGITKRKPSQKEQELANLWVNEWNYQKDILEKAYDACVNSTGKFSTDYIKTILENWHSNGVKTIDDINDIKVETKKKNTKKKNDFAAYDRNDIENIIFSED